MMTNRENHGLAASQPSRCPAQNRTRRAGGSPSIIGHSRAPLAAIALFLCLFGIMGETRAAEQPLPAERPLSAFEGGKTAWHDGFARYDFVMDEQTLTITPFKAPTGENFGINPAPNGQWRCVVIEPKTAAPGNPWSWRGCYWDQALGGAITVILKEGEGHYPLAPRDPQPVVDFIIKQVGL